MTIPKIKNQFFLIYILTGIIVSCYYFPFGFNFLPEGFNTKIGLAFIGILILGYKLIETQKIKIDKKFLIAIIFSLIYSIVGYISVDINNSNDYTYATYYISFATWSFASFATCYILTKIYGYCDFTLVVDHLIAISVVQCIIAFVIDNNEPFKNLVDTYISQNTVADVEFLNDVERLYGIGAALDVAGTRFSVVLLALIAVLTHETKNYARKWKLTLYWSAFLIIAILGNIISRTTSIGVVLSLSYWLLSNFTFNFNITKKYLNLIKVTFFTTAVGIILTIYFYNTNKEFYSLLRFGFEGFFNLVEKGELRTDSTDRLNTVMWNWPTNIEQWVIGSADFSFEFTGTDIGYCKFVFYSGIIGLTIFSLFFIFNAYANILNFPELKLFIITILILGFIIWLKVATDLYIFYALLYFIDKKNIQRI